MFILVPTTTCYHDLMCCHITSGWHIVLGWMHPSLRGHTHCHKATFIVINQKKNCKVYCIWLRIYAICSAHGHTSIQCGSWFPFAPATPLPHHLPVGSVHNEQVGACIPCLVYLLLSPYYLTPGLFSQVCSVFGGGNGACASAWIHAGSALEHSYIYNVYQSA
jgi:hypothetical protein